jgi:hypothetical protein
MTHADHALPHALAHSPAIPKPGHAQLLGNLATRGQHNFGASLAMLPALAHTETWLSLTQLQAASLQKLIAQQDGWLAQWQSWLHSACQLSQANTVSKLLEQEVNLTLRAVQIMGQQAVDLATLQENLEVNYGYWASLHTPAAPAMQHGAD